MARTFGEDLRGRVIAAVDGGMSRRGAAERFQVGIATAIRWVRAWRDDGRRTALPKGGDLHSHRIEAHRDASLDTIASKPKQEHGASFAPSTVHRFCIRHRLTLKKRRRTQPNRTARMWPAGGSPGSTASPTSTPNG